MSKESEIMQFLKDAWCIDGDVKPIGHAQCTKLIPSSEHNYIGRMYELTDSKRGKFVIFLSES